MTPTLSVPARFVVKLPPLLTVALMAKLIAIALWSIGAHPRLGSVFFFGLDPILLYQLFVPSSQGLVRVATRFVTERREVWLTIDDGPDPEDTPRILDVLDRYQARATFFVIGERVARWPHLVREIVRRGHTVAHHTQTHPALSLWCAGPRRLARELDQPITELRALGLEPGHFRPPVGIKHLLLGPLLARRKLLLIGWSVRSGDSLASTPEAVAAHVSRRLHPGAIVLVHEGPGLPAAIRVQGIERILESITAGGYRCIVPRDADLR